MSPSRPSGPRGPRGTAEGSDLTAVLDSLTEARRAERTVMSTSADRAARRVREEVVEGRLRSGSRLPEEHLGAALGVSRNTVREALNQLVAERILVREPNRGVVVATPSVDDVEDLYRVRLLVEPAALEHGTGHTPARTDAVAAAVSEGRHAAGDGDGDAVASANQHFHRAVVALAGSPRLDAQMDLLLAEMRLVFHRMDDPAPFHLPYLEQNAQIATLLAAGERAEAARRLAAYLASARDQLVARLHAAD